MRTFLATLLLALMTAPVVGHDLRHGVQHVDYKSWVNRDGKGCCNNQDCRPIADEDVQMSPVLKVKIGAEWCPVLPQHYLRQGNAPDWQSNHVCVELWSAKPACERLLCFQPKPLF